MLTKILLIALYAGFAGIDLFSVQLFFHRPLVTGPIIGWILGDVEKGFIMGAMLELIWIGMVPLGGVQPPNVVIGGIVGISIAIVIGITPKFAISIAILFAIIGQLIIIFILRSYKWFVHRADKYAEKVDIRKIEFINIAGIIPQFIIYFIFIYLTLYFGIDVMKNIINKLPENIMEGFEIAGAILPSVGAAMLLKSLLKKENIYILLIAFIFAVYFKHLIIKVIIIGIIAGFISYFNEVLIKSDGGNSIHGL